MRCDVRLRSVLWPLFVVTANACALFISLDDYPDAAGAGAGGGGAMSGCPTASDAGADAALEPTRARALGASAVDVQVTALAVGDAGSMIVGGFCKGGTIDFGLDAGAEPCDPTNESMFVLGLDSALEPEWRVLAKTTNESTHLWGVAMGSGGDALITGVVGESMILGECVMQAIGTDRNDAFVARISPDGQCLWSQVGGGTEFDEGEAIAVDGDSIYIAGTYGATFKFPSGGATLQAPSGRLPFFAAKLDAKTGVPSWVTDLGGDLMPTYGRAKLAVGENGIWVVGSSRVDLLGCTDDVTYGTLGFVARLGTDGKVFAHRCFPTGGMPVAGQGAGVRMDAIQLYGTDEAVCLGATVAGATAQLENVTIAGGELFAAHLGQDVAPIWAFDLGGFASAQYPWALVPLHDGRMAAAGTSYDNLSITEGAASGLQAYAVIFTPGSIPSAAVRFGQDPLDVQAAQIPLALGVDPCAAGIVMAGRFQGSLAPIALTAPPGQAQGFVAELSR